MGLSIERNVYSEYAEQLESIERLCAQPITEELHEEIIDKLDAVHGDLSKCEITAAKTNIFVLSLVKQLQSKMVDLYGRADSSFYEHEIGVIKEEAQSLALTFQQKDLLKIASVFKSLRSHLNHLLESYRPPLAERGVVVFAKQILEHAEALLQGKTVEELDLSECPFVEQEILEELAEYLGTNDRVSLSLLWKRLSPAQKKLVLAYMSNPQDLLSCLLHNIEGSAHQEQFFGG
ncbi:MAG TPA: hypothetical protein VMR37_03330 [Rhabdochlamydiaceae bacterium]|nr:hypothetical protein [Rhabdochlamydiaceae bacterium]